MGTKLHCTTGVWMMMDDVRFYVPLRGIQSYQDDGRVTMKDCVWGCKEFHLQWVFNPTALGTAKTHRVLAVLSAIGLTLNC